MNFHPRRKDPPDLNLIPMIDVLIVLLIFLVLTTTFARERAIRLNLPQVQGPTEATPRGLEITIDATGLYYVNQHPVRNTELPALKQALREAAGDNPDPLVVISADRKTPHEAVIRTLDAAGQLGFVHITFAAMSEPESKSAP